jgi:Lipocalin-like domain
MKRISTGAGTLLLLWSMSAAAQNHPGCTGLQIGTRKLQSMTTECLDNDQKTQPYGPHPAGYLSYGPDCRMYANHRQREPQTAGGGRPDRGGESFTSWASCDAG